MTSADPDPLLDPPLTVELLADLQAGLLDDHTATRVRRRVRTDPPAAATLGALHRVRSDVAAARPDQSHKAPRAAHAARPPLPSLPVL